MSEGFRGGRVRAWWLSAVFAAGLTVLLLTFPSQGVSFCPYRAVLSTDGGGCVSNVLSWNSWVRFPDWQWLPWAYLLAMGALLVALVVTVRRAASRR
jgi:hypothetical protein